MNAVFTPYRLGGVTLRNRFLKTATFEGMSPGGEVTPALIEHHRAVAAGGVAMTTVAYCAVSADGRTFADQLHMRPALVPALRRLTDAVHREGSAASLQLGHCGGFSNNHDLGPRRPLGPSFGFNALGALSGRVFRGAMSPQDIEDTTAAFVSAVGLARESGFDAVEIHLGHGYLLSQFLSPWTNRRRDAWGGTLENRARFALDVMTRVRAALPADFPVLAKVNLRDGFRGGVEVEDCVEFSRWLAARGVDALVLSGGFVSRDAFYLFRGERPLREMIAVEKSPAQRVALRLFGPAVIRAHPFEPLYFLPLARQVRAHVPLPLVLLGGITACEHAEQALSEGFPLVAMGRALLHDPALVRRWQYGDRAPSGCTPCNRCVAEMDRDGGVRCAQVPAQLAAREASIRRGETRSVRD